MSSSTRLAQRMPKNATHQASATEEMYEASTEDSMSPAVDYEGRQSTWTANRAPLSVETGPVLTGEGARIAGGRLQDGLDMSRPVTLAPSVASLLAKAVSQPESSIFDTQSFWKASLVKLLPTRNQGDFLIAYYFENINHVYHVVHVPSFRREYNHFWDLSIDEIDLVWLSLLFTMISLSALYISPDVAQAIGLDGACTMRLGKMWHSASRQALHSGGFESKPQLLQISTFLATQLYWLSMKDGEGLNSALGQAVRNAQALKLDRDVPGATVLETEMRRRLWWELCVCDTFQSLCFGRVPLIQTKPNSVPLPANCNDDGVRETSKDPSPMNVPTDMSANIVKAELFRILRFLFTDDSAYANSWEFVHALDRQLGDFLQRLPWYFSDRQFCQAERLDQLPAFAVWQHALIHSTVRMQRFKMLRPFLGTHPEASAICNVVAREILDGFKYIHSRSELQGNPKLHISAYQWYSIAVQLAAYLLVEPSPPEGLRADVEMVIKELEVNPFRLPVTSDSHKILRKMLQMHDRGSQTTQVQEAIATEIAPYFGGEGSTRRYLRRCDIAYLLNGDSAGMFGNNSGRLESFNPEMRDLSEFDVSLDMLGMEQYGLILQEVNAVQGW